MNNHLKLMYLGKMQVWQGSTPLTGFISRKAEALLCYLATTGQPHARQVLTSLFWEDMPEANARRNLRVTLTNLRQLVGSHLFITNQAAMFNQQSAHWLDVTQFNQLFQPQPLTIDPDNVQQFEQAAALYTGEFLAGFHVRQAPVWEEWVLTKRERFSQRAWYIYHQLSRYFITQSHYQKGIFYASRLLALDPLQEEAHRQMMWLLAASGQRGAALFQYETCCRLLSEELGVAPTAETVKLYTQIREGVFPVSSAQPDSTPLVVSGANETPRPWPHNLPFPSTPFVGRASELAEVARLLEADACHLITLAGPGGVGKTRLALQAGRERVTDVIQQFPHGIFFIPLASISAAEHIAPALSDILPGASYGQGDPQTLLLNYLRSKRMLLILDNFEHLLAAAAPLLGNILHTAPNVKMIVTSREALHLPGEWTLEIRGLPFPEGAFPPEMAEKYGAVQLFLMSARRLNAGFARTPEELVFAARICQLVDGLPLALELASTWAWALSGAEIAAEIEQNLDFLSNASLRGVPERHQSLRAVFDHSWRLLTERERDVLQRLSVFRGGFDRQAAEAVAGADIVMLSNLVNKFMLRRHNNGRYGLHTLLRQYLWAILNAAKATCVEACDRHATYYLTYCQSQEPRLKGQEQKGALQELRAEIENIRAAWQWAAKHGRVSLIACACETLYIFYEIRAWMQEGLQAFLLAAQQVAQIAHDPDTQLTWGRLCARQGRFTYRLGRYQEARECLEKSLSTFRRCQAYNDVAFALDQLATLAYLTSQYEQAQVFADESLALYRQTGDTFGLATCLNTSGTFYYLIGQHATARVRLEESLAICQANGDQRGAARSRLNLGSIAIKVQAYDEARQHYQESLVTFRELGDRRGMAVSLNNMGTVAEMLGEYENSRRYHLESLGFHREAGDPGMITALEGLGNVACELGEFEMAWEHFYEALVLAREQGILPLTINVLTAVARLQGRQGDMQKAVALAAFCCRHPASQTGNKVRAQTVLDEMKSQLPAPVYAAAEAASQGKDLQDVLAELL